MKDYTITKIWAVEISNISEIIDIDIEYKKEAVQQRKLDVANEEPNANTNWLLEQIEENEEKIKALQWILNTINAPFKISKK